MFTATKLQAATYLLGVCLFSIAFLVFLNSSISFVITDLIGQRTQVGNAVGTLGFADELVVLVACPAWGVVSDRLGVRMVSSNVIDTITGGLTIVGLRLGLLCCRPCTPALCASPKCVSAVATCQTVVQRRWRSDFDYGYRNSSFHDLASTGRGRRATGCYHTSNP